MQYKSYFHSQTGMGKSINQDSFFSCDQKGLYIVSDGLGAYKGSEIASQIVVGTLGNLFQKVMPEEDEKWKKWLRKGVNGIPSLLDQLVKRQNDLKRMAATLTLLYLQPPFYHIGQVGDSRGYFFKDGQLVQITQDHSVAFEQYLAGAISKNEVVDHPNQKLLTRTISGGKTFVLTDIFSGVLQKGTRFLLCSDGLSKGLKDGEIAEMFQSYSDGNHLVSELIKYAQLGGGNDDITVGLVEVV